MIIPFFLRNRGCPHRCIFCSERITGGEGADGLAEAEFGGTVEKYLASGRKKEPAEIAFYGGNFLEMGKEVQNHLFRLAGPWIDRKAVGSLRISTRPDSITEERLDFLGKHHVGAIEIGAQSLVDRVLENARRGHSAEDVRKAVGMCLDGGFRTGIHLMAGLPGEREADFLHSVREAAGLRPHMVRIHPTLVFRNTGLEKAWREGTYAALSLDEAVDRCRAALEIFESAGVFVIRVGLQATEALEEELIAGPYHPALRNLAESARFLEKAKRLLSALPPGTEERRVVFRVSPKDGSFVRGQGNATLKKLHGLFPGLKVEILEDGNAKRGTLSLAPSDQKGQRPPT